MFCFTFSRKQPDLKGVLGTSHIFVQGFGDLPPNSKQHSEIAALLFFSRATRTSKAYAEYTIEENLAKGVFSLTLNNRNIVLLRKYVCIKVYDQESPSTTASQMT